MRVISQQELNWRKDKIRELRDKKYTQREIAVELKVDHAIVNRYLKSMHEGARKKVEHYIDEILPDEYESTLNTLDMIMKEMWKMEPKDNRELIQSRDLIKECALHKFGLIANSTTVDRAIKFVERKKTIILPRGSTDQNIKVVIDDNGNNP